MFSSPSSVDSSSFSRIALRARPVSSLHFSELVEHAPYMTHPVVQASTAFEQVMVPSLLVVVGSFSSMASLVIAGLPILSIVFVIFAPLPPQLILQWSSVSRHLPCPYSSAAVVISTSKSLVRVVPAASS